jgi:tripartite-type tricarboxylate transporter receptor subunit TctC
MRAILAALALLASAGTCAQSWPTKPVRIISTYGPGSVAEINFRLVLERVSQALGQPMLLEARAGAGGVVGADLVARSTPDGYTLLYANASTLITSPLLMKKKLFEVKDFAPITVIYEGVTCFVVNAAFPVSSMKELVDYVKKNPGKFAYGHNGIGGNYHLQMESIKLQHGLDLIGVPYKGGTAALLDTVTGTIPMSFTATATAQPFMKTGKVRMLAITDMKRHPDFPDVPAMGEELPNFEKMPTALSLYGPAGLPSAIANRMQAEVVKGLSVPEIRAKNREAGFYAVGTTPEQTLAQLLRDREVTAKAVKAAGLKPE